MEYLLETNNKVIEKVSSKDVAEAMNILAASFNKIKYDYIKCLTVLDILDNAAGSLSERILATLLSNKKLKAVQVGGSQGLTDIEVDLHGKKFGISLKTTDGSKPIGLGSDEKNDVKLPEKAVFQKIQAFHKKPIKQALKNKEISDTISARIDGIVRKLCGDDGNEIFFWVEKLKDSKKRLIGFQFHLKKFVAKNIKELLESCIIHVTDNSYGFSYENTPFVRADNAKYLNVTKDFVYMSDELGLTKTDNRWKISLVDNQTIKTGKIVADFQQKVQDEVTTKANKKFTVDDNKVNATYISSLLKMYNDIVGTAPKK